MIRNDCLEFSKDHLHHPELTTRWESLKYLIIGIVSGAPFLGDAHGVKHVCLPETSPGAHISLRQARNGQAPSTPLILCSFI